MATAAEHYRKADLALTQAAMTSRPEERAAWCARAQAHATLALVGATLAAGIGEASESDIRLYDVAVLGKEPGRA